MAAGVSETMQSTAQIASEGAAQVVPVYSWNGYFMGLAFMFIMLGLLWFGARFIKQKGGLRFLGQTPSLNVESRLSIGQRKHILVLCYQGKRLLLGVTDHHISLLAEESCESEHLDGDESSGEAPLSQSEHLHEGRGLGIKFKDMLHDLNKSK